MYLVKIIPQARILTLKKNVEFEKERNIKSYQKNLKIIWRSKGESPLLECIIFLLVRIYLC